MALPTPTADPSLGIQSDALPSISATIPARPVLNKFGLIGGYKPPVYEPVVPPPKPELPGLKPVKTKGGKHEVPDGPPEATTSYAGALSKASTKQNKSSSTKLILLAVLIPVLVLLAILALILFLRHRKKTRAKAASTSDGSSSTDHLQQTMPMTEVGGQGNHSRNGNGGQQWEYGPVAQG